MTGARKARLVVVPNHDGGSWGDRELVAALRADDPRGAVMTWRKYAPRVFGIVQRTMGPTIDAEDVTQEIFLRVFARVSTLRDPDAFGSFIISFTLRIIKWQLRQKRVRSILRLADDAQLAEVPSREFDAEARQALFRLYEVLETLSVDDRTVFALRHIEGMELQEIATALGKSLATVKRWLQRASAKVSARVEADPMLRAYAGKKGHHET